MEQMPQNGLRPAQSQHFPVHQIEHFKNSEKFNAGENLKKIQQSVSNIKKTPELAKQSLENLNTDDAGKINNLQAAKVGMRELMKMAKENKPFLLEKTLLNDENF